MLILGGVALAYQASRVILKDYAQRSLVRANVATINLHAISGLLMAAAILGSSAIASVLGHQSDILFGEGDRLVAF